MNKKGNLIPVELYIIVPAITIGILVGLITQSSIYAISAILITAALIYVGVILLAWYYSRKGGLSHDE